VHAFEYISSSFPFFLFWIKRNNPPINASFNKLPIIFKVENK